MNTITKDIKFWERVIENLNKNKEKPFVKEIIANVEKTLENLKSNNK